MTDIRCWRCHHKLAVNNDGRGSMTIKCPSCKAINHVTLDKGITVAAQ